MLPGRSSVADLRHAALVLLSAVISFCAAASALAEQVPQRTDAEGEPLPPGVAARLGSSRMRQEPSAEYLDFSLDGKWVVSGGTSAFVNVWDVATGKRCRRFEVPENADSLALFLSDGRLAWCEVRKAAECRVWDASTGKQLKSLQPGAESPNQSVALSKQGHWAIGDSTRVWIYGPTGDLLTRYATTGQQGWQEGPGLNFSTDAKRLAIANLSDTLRIVETGQNKEVLALKAGGEQFTSAVFSSDGRLLVSLSYEQRAAQPVPKLWGAARLWDLTTGRRIRRLGPDDFAISAALSGDGRSLAIGTFKEIVLWDVATGKERRRLWTRRAPVAVAFSPDGSIVAGVSRAGEITLWDVGRGQLLPASAEPRTEVGDLQFVSEGKQLLGTAEAIYAWDTSSGRLSRRVEELAGSAHRVALSPNGRLLASNDRDAVYLRNVGGGTVRLPTAKDSYTWILLFTPDSKRLITGCHDRAVRIWDVSDGKQVRVLSGHDGPVDQLAVSPDGRLLAAANDDASAGVSVRVWELDSGRELKRYSIPFAVHGLSFSADGKRLAVVGDSSGYIVWDVESGSETALSGPGAASSVAFSPDGRMIATGGSDHVACLWELSTGKQRLSLSAHRAPIGSVTFSRDGRFLASSSAEAPVYLWDVAGRMAERLNLSRQELEQAWQQLAGADAAVAWRAIRRLASSSDGAVSFLGERIKPVPPVDETRLRNLVRRLDSPKFSERKQAAEEVRQVAPQAAAFLKRTLKGASSAEVRDALRNMLDQRKLYSPDTLREVRAIESLEWMATPGASQVLGKLAAGAPDAILTSEAAAALKRLGDRQAR
jgi:WD40 repeat protein